MKPKTNHKMTKQEFDILKTTLKNTLQISRLQKEDNGAYTEMPRYIGIKLTNACNLRCKHCYQWNESGYHRFMQEQKQKAELPLEVIKQILDETEQEKARLYLWGGEPLVYSRLTELLELLRKYKREVAICTNALWVERYLDDLVKLDKLELLIGLEGPETIHDSIRGNGTFRRAINNINALVAKKREGSFAGKISVHTMISDGIRNELFNYLCFLESIGVEMVIVCFPWYIADDCKTQMDEYYHSKCRFLPTYSETGRHSWYSFNYNFGEQYIGDLLEQFTQINNKTWNMIIRYQPDLAVNEIDNFILGKEITSKRKCLAVSERTEINPDGTVSACKYFDEFVMGDLKNTSLKEVWHSEPYRIFRDMICAEQMPICSKCSELSLHGIEEK